MSQTDGIRFQNIVEYEVFDKDGIIKDYQMICNQVQNYAFQVAIDLLDTGVVSFGSVITMSVGTGAAINVSTDALTSTNSSVASTATGPINSGLTKSQPSAAQLQVIGKFSNFGTTPITITEAGLFGSSDGSSKLLFYSTPALSVTVGSSSDTLQITWTINATV